jgi:hypothetical protein
VWGEKRSIRKPEENRPLERPRHRWEGHIKLCLKEMRWQAAVNMLLNLQVP